MNTHHAKPRLAIITCAVLEDEVLHFAQDRPHIVHIDLLEQGLHNEPLRLRERVQEAIDRIETQYPEAEATALGYGLCSRGTEGVQTRRCQLVMARAHDCITLLLGSKERYADYVAQNPGTYWYSPGWNRHHIPPGQERYERLRTDYVEKYGEDNADFLMEAEQTWFSHYNRATYVDLGIDAVQHDVEYTQQCAKWLGWKFDRQQGDASLMRDLMECEWDEERFVILEPGQIFRMTTDERVIEATPAGCDCCDNKVLCGANADAANNE